MTGDDFKPPSFEMGLMMGGLGGALIVVIAFLVFAAMVTR